MAAIPTEERRANVLDARYEGCGRTLNIADHFQISGRDNVCFFFFILDALDKLGR